MLDKLRTPFLVAALVVVLLVVLIESGTTLALPVPPVSRAELQAIVDEAPEDARDEVEVGELEALRAENPSPPGLGIPYLALLDALVLFVLGLVAASLLVGERLYGRVQGLVTLIVSLLALLGSLGLVLAAFGKLMVRLGLFLSAPFGTIAYMAIYGFFDRRTAATILALVMLGKLGTAVLLVLAHQRFLQNKGLVLILLTALLANLVVTILHGLVPVFLVSITDALAAVVVGILAAIWCVVLLAGAVVSVVKVLRVDRAS